MSQVKFDEDGRPIFPKTITDSPTTKRNGVKRSGHYYREQKKLELESMKIQLPWSKMTAEKVKNMKFLREELRLTFQQHVDKMPEFVRLTEKQVRFYKAYVQLGRRSKIKAMQLAGYMRKSAQNLWNDATILLRKPEADDIMRAFEFEEKARMLLTVEDVVQWFQNIATKALDVGDFTNANRAMENLGKYLGMFVERKEVKITNITSKDDLDAEIARLRSVLEDNREDIERQITVN